MIVNIWSKVSEDALESIIQYSASLAFKMILRFYMFLLNFVLFDYIVLFDNIVIFSILDNIDLSSFKYLFQGSWHPELLISNDIILHLLE